MLDWAFRSRRTGRITVAQMPNLSLALFLVASIVGRILRPSGRPATALGALATAALVWWAADELLRGVNPWRRFLGGGVLGWMVVRVALRLV